MTGPRKTRRPPPPLSYPSRIYKRPPGSPEPVVFDPNAPIPYAVGDKVQHLTFGEGVVMRNEEGKLTIQFAKSVIRKVMESFVERVG